MKHLPKATRQPEAAPIPEVALETLLIPRKPENANTAPVVEARAHPQIGLVRKAASFALLGFGVSCLFVMDQVDIVMNASHSLEAPAFIMWEKPYFLDRGTIISAEMPELLKATFGDYHYVKWIGGLPGDVITHNAAGAPCIGSECFPLFHRDGAPIAAAIAAGPIPEGYYAVFGTSDDSLDSRYGAIGLISEDKLLGRGWALAQAPDWRETAE